MGNKLYAVVHKETGIVFAKYFECGYSKLPKLNDVKIGILDYNPTNGIREIKRVVLASLSSTKGMIEKTEVLESDSFITEPHYPYFKDKCDYIFLSHHPEKLLALLGNEEG